VAKANGLAHDHRPIGDGVLGGWFHRFAQKTEFVALGVGEYVPGFLAGLPHVGLSGAEPEETL
jgi:hypothetical protein